MGTAIPGWHVRVLDEEGRGAPPGTPGEVCLLARSNPNYPLGYWRRPEESDRDFGGTWFHTKDIAYCDDDGYFWYVGRKDDVIKAAGYRVGPHEVEATLRRHPMVLEAAVIGVPDTERGARIVAYVALPEGASGSDDLVDELRAIVREEHSAFAYPREVHFMRDLPRSSTGKIDRATLRRRYGEAPTI
jgi:acetyl-CoA synthetase